MRNVGFDPGKPVREHGGKFALSRPCSCILAEVLSEKWRIKLPPAAHFRLCSELNDYGSDVVTDPAAGLVDPALVGNLCDGPRGLLRAAVLRRDLYRLLRGHVVPDAVGAEHDDLIVPIEPLADNLGIPRNERVHVRSPRERDTPSPHVPPLSQTRSGPIGMQPRSAPAQVVRITGTMVWWTRPCKASIRLRSSGLDGVWSQLRSRACSFPFGARRPSTARESPQFATTMLAGSGKKAVTAVVPE